MKRSRILSILVILAVVGAFSFMALDANAAKASASGKPMTVTGTVAQEGSEYTLTSGKTTYTITGQDFSAYVGKKVKASGKVTKSDGGATMDVTNVKEVPTKAAPTPAKKAK